MAHSIYKAAWDGFNDRLDETSSRIDEYGEQFTANYYESGRHLATWFMTEKLDVNFVNQENIISFFIYI